MSEWYRNKTINELKGTVVTVAFHGMPYVIEGELGTYFSPDHLDLRGDGLEDLPSVFHRADDGTIHLTDETAYCEPAHTAPADAITDITKVCEGDHAVFTGAQGTVKAIDLLDTTTARLLISIDDTLAACGHITAWMLDTGFKYATRPVDPLPDLPGPYRDKHGDIWTRSETGEWRRIRRQGRWMPNGGHKPENADDIAKHAPFTPLAMKDVQ